MTLLTDGSMGRGRDFGVWSRIGLKKVKMQLKIIVVECWGFIVPAAHNSQNCTEYTLELDGRGGGGIDV